VARGVVEEEPALPGQHRDGKTVDLHGRACSKFLMHAGRNRTRSRIISHKKSGTHFRCGARAGGCRIHHRGHRERGERHFEWVGVMAGHRGHANSSQERACISRRAWMVG
jgi:hypothetical protein